MTVPSTYGWSLNAGLTVMTSFYLWMVFVGKFDSNDCSFYLWVVFVGKFDSNDCSFYLWMVFVGKLDSNDWSFYK